MTTKHPRLDPATFVTFPVTMKQLRKLFITLALFGLVTAGKAQPFTNLHSFAGGSEGASPVIGGVIPPSTLYGTSESGGTSNGGAVFAINPDGSNLRVLHNFGVSGDGKNPRSGLVLAGNTLYGTSEAGGTSAYGTIFKVNTDGSGYTNLHSFSGSSGGSTPEAGLVLVGNRLYGTVNGGGSGSAGAVFAINTDGTGFQLLHNFAALSQGTNSEGANPVGDLVASGNTLYGTAQSGGSTGSGTVFRLNTDGSSFTNLHNFTGNDGSDPAAALVISGNRLYGNAMLGGTFGDGTVFSLNTDGTAFTNLHNFSGSDGSQPDSSLVLSANLLFGTTSVGGSNNEGTIFSLNTDGSGFTDLHVFSGSSDGAYPLAGLNILGNRLFGNASGGGLSEGGTVFVVNTDGTGFTNLFNFNGYIGGSSPEAVLVMPQDALYGWAQPNGSSGPIFLMATNGGVLTTLTNTASVVVQSGATFYAAAGGTVFKVNTDGSGYTVLHTFTNDTAGGLVVSGNSLYGTTEGQLGTVRSGSVFAINTDGTGFEALHQFSSPTFNGVNNVNSDGANPWPAARLVLSGQTLYGTTPFCGASGGGTLFSVNIDATGFSVLHTFAVSQDGFNPLGGLVLSGGALYGTSAYGGSNQEGTIFAINTNGAGYQILHSFSKLVQNSDPTNGIIVNTNFDGAVPEYGLALSGETLYGTTSSGGLTGNGTVFGINTDGTGFAVLHEFTAFPNGSHETNSDGATPTGVVVGDDGAVYGSASAGGAYGDGTIFRLTWPPQITAQPLNAAAPLGGSASVTVTVLGATPVFYQWQHNGTNLVDNGRISGSAGVTLSLSGIGSGDAGSYQVVVGNPFGSVTSVVATLATGNLVVLPSELIDISAPGNVLSLEAALATNFPDVSFDWSDEIGANQPDPLTIANPFSSNTSVTFDFAGTYVISLGAMEGTNELQAQVTVNVGTDPNGSFQNISNFVNGPLLTTPNTFLLDDYNSSPGDTGNYYAAIDPAYEKSTFTDWEIANGIPTNPIPASTTNFMGVVSATYFNAQDLGFGRRLIMKGTNGGNWAYAVINYNSLQDAINDSNRIVTEAMDYSTIPGEIYPFTKFYLFDSTGARVTTANLDGGGDKWVPGVCMVCHGGLNGGAISPGESQLSAHFQPLDLEALLFSSSSNLTRAAQEPSFKLLNEGVLNIEQDIEGHDFAHFSAAIPELIQGWYGATLTNTTQNNSFVPPGWQDNSSTNVLSLAGQASLYRQIVSPSCRACHVTRDLSQKFGTNSLDFRSFTNFNTLRSAVDADVFGNAVSLAHLNPITYTLNPNSSPNGTNTMPQSRRTFQRFWNSLAPVPQSAILLDFLDGALASEVPTITSQPASQTVSIGESMVQFSVSASATAPLSYQWQFYSGGQWVNLTDGTATVGSQSSELTLFDIQTNAAGDYQCLVTNIYGSQASSAATLALYPAIVAQPVNTTAPAGSAETLNVSVAGTGPFAYEWYFNQTNPLNNVIATLAGNGTNGFSGDGAVATNANLNFPSSVAVDGYGNVFIADTSNNRIRKVDTNGFISTVAGSGSGGGYSGDGGPATSAHLYSPEGVALDGNGNLFIAETVNGVIRKVDTNGIITTVAGNGQAGYSGNGGMATNASMASPSAVAVDAYGNLFIADTGNNVVREVYTNGLINTVAGNGSSGYGGDGSWAVFANLASPSGVAVDSHGNLFVADKQNERIRRVDTNGVITTVAGSGNLSGSLGDGGPATNAIIYQPDGVAVDTNGNFFIADTGNGLIRKVDTNGIITTVAGSGSSGTLGDGDLATNASLQEPTGVAVDGPGELFIADEGNQRVRKVNAPGQTTLTLKDVAFMNAGNYFVVATSPYGAVTSSVVTLTVVQAAPVLTWANPAPIIYGAALSTNQLSATANVAGLFAYTPIIGTELNTGTNLLSVVFTPTDSTDYTRGTNVVSLLVTPAPLTVTASNSMRGYGQTNPVFTGSIVGLVNGDNMTASYGCAAVPASPPGTYPIVPVLIDPNNRETNYAVTLNYGTLTIQPPGSNSVAPFDFGSRLQIFLSGYTGDETLSNFPVLVNLSTNLSGFSYRQFASATGADLRFTDSGGLTLIPHEIDEWNTNGVSSVWVSVPALSKTNNTIWAYWGNPATNIPAFPSTNVWLNAGYQIVYHLKESGFPYADSTGQFPANRGVATQRTSGIVGHGQAFNGATTYLTPGVVGLSNTFTTSAWVFLNAGATNIQTIWCNQLGGYGNNGFAEFVDAFGTADRGILIGSGDGSVATGQQPEFGYFGTSQWHLFTVAFDRPNSNLVAYLDGSVVGTGPVTSDFGLANNLYLGAFLNPNFWWTGAMDEARIKIGIVSSNWVAASWQTVASNSSFESFYTVARQSPPLQLGTIQGGLRMAWPASGVGMSVYSSTNLSSPGAWTLVTNAIPELINGQWQVVLPTNSSKETYFRLRGN